MTKTYSFNELITDKIEIFENNFENIRSIEIPAIQRDYAQGRVDPDSVAEAFEDQLKGSGFISSVFTHLQKNEVMIMDFVYGSFVDGKFVPLDGQQRLTTLFLLYWYIGKIELGENSSAFIKKLSAFTYQTRDSDRKFCKYLCSETIKFQNNKTICEILKNEHWFYKEYEKDPTIKAMFNMLKVIETKYALLPKLDESDSYLKRLDNLRFYILPLTNFNLSDDLYVKMNARGKKLSTYENFKADLTNWMNDEKNPYKAFFAEIVDYDERQVSEAFRISLKFDNEWTDEIWSLVKDNTRKLNEPFMQLFHRFALNKYLIYSSSDAKTKGTSELYKRFTGSYENEYDEKHYQDFKNIFELDQKNDSNVIKDFEIFFDNYHKNSEKIQKAIQPCWAKKEEEKYSIFISTVKNEKAFNARNRIAFYGIQKYLENFEYDDIHFRQWMRVVWNIAQNTDITDATVMIGVLQLIDELGFHANCIYTFLSDKNNLIKSKSSKIAIEEERRKAAFIVKNPKINWEKNFKKAESHPYLKGEIDFLIDDDMEENKFLHRVDMANLLFEENGFSDNYRKEGHLLLRALISNYSSYEEFYTKEYKKHRKFFIDIRDSENYLKKMLTPGSESGDSVFINNIKRYLDEKNETQLKEILLNDVKRSSQIYINGKKSGKLNEKYLKNLKLAHESLYNVVSIQNWMQDHDAIRFEFSKFYNICVAKPLARYNWIYFDEYRVEIAKYLISKGFNPNSKIGKTHICWGYAGYSKEIRGHTYLVWLNTNGEVKLKIDDADSPMLKLNYVTAESKDEDCLEFCKKISKQLKI